MIKSKLNREEITRNEQVIKKKTARFQITSIIFEKANPTMTS